MDTKQIATLAKTFVNSMIDSWFVIFSIAGVMVFAASYVVSFPPESYWTDTLRASGALILASGSFSAMTRWLSVHGIVKKELHNILYGNDYLKEQRNFNHVWEQLVAASVNNHMPSLAPHLHKDFLREYLPSEKEIFYKHYQQSFDVYWQDKDNRIIKVIEQCDITLTTSSSDDHFLPYTLEAEYPVGKALSYKVQTLKIDGKCKLGKVKHDKSEHEGVTKDKISYRLKLTGKTEYKYYRKMERLIYLDYEPFIVVGSGWHTYKPSITVNCHDEGIKAFFTSTGTLKGFTTIDGANNSRYMKEEYPELMMKAQGYSIYFAPS